jgi:hypothetical protein
MFGNLAIQTLGRLLGLISGSFERLLQSLLLKDTLLFQLGQFCPMGGLRLGNLGLQFCLLVAALLGFFEQIFQLGFLLVDEAAQPGDFLARVSQRFLQRSRLLNITRLVNVNEQIPAFRFTSLGSDFRTKAHR